jgi:hypothetical protein
MSIEVNALGAWEEKFSIETVYWPDHHDEPMYHVSLKTDKVDVVDKHFLREMQRAINTAIKLAEEDE